MIDMTDSKEIEWGGTGWINLAQDRDKWQGCKCGNKISSPYNVGNFLTS